MRFYMIDELSKEERDNIDTYLKRTLNKGALEGLFFLMLPDDLMGEAQMGHDACRPFCFAVELTEDSLRFEMLIRSQSNMHCDCIAYATPLQRDFILRFADALLSEEFIRA